MRVALVHATYREIGGEDVYVHSLRRVLESRGHVVAMFERLNGRTRLSAAAQLAASSHNPRAARQVTDGLRAFAPDVVHVHNTWFAFSRAVPARVANSLFPVVQTVHNFRLRCVNGACFRDGHQCTDCLGGSAAPGIAHRCYRGSTTLSAIAALSVTVDQHLRDLSRDVSLLHFLTESSRAVLLPSLRYPAARTRVIPNFVPDPGPRQSPPSASAQVLYVGRLSREKGVHWLIETWRRVRPALHLDIVGDGPELAALRCAAADDASIRIVGPQTSEEVRRRMMSARAIVVPSLWFEGQPLVLLEALAAGLACVTTGLGGLREVMSRGEAGLIVDVAGPGLGRALLALEREGSVDRWGTSARALYERHYTPPAVAPQIEELYTQAIAVAQRDRGR